MRKALLFLCLGIGLIGCASVKMTLTDPATGGTWMIKEHPLGSDEIYYCSTGAGKMVQCREAQME